MTIFVRGSCSANLLGWISWIIGLGLLLVCLTCHISYAAAEEETHCRDVDFKDRLDAPSYLYDLSKVRTLNVSVSTRSIGVDWALNDTEARELCGFTTHIWKPSESNDTAVSVYKQADPEVRALLITDLAAGTRYEILVETIFLSDVNRAPISWWLTTHTHGYGPDNTVIEGCDCFSPGTEICDGVTGTCECKPMLTLGDKCDQCVPRSYMHPVHGCSICDQCPEAPAGYGTCVYHAEEQMLCNCSVGYVGKHCRECAAGYTMVLNDNMERVDPFECVPCVNYVNGTCLDNKKTIFLANRIFVVILVIFLVFVTSTLIYYICRRYAHTCQSKLTSLWNSKHQAVGGRSKVKFSPMNDEWDDEVSGTQDIHFERELQQQQHQQQKQQYQQRRALDKL